MESERRAPGWPIVEIDASGVDADAAHAVVSEGLLAAVARETEFSAVVHMPEAPARGRKISGAADRVRMLKRLRPGLAARCRGMAFVVSVATQQANAKAIRSGRKLWGCPTLATDDVEAARAWAKAQLTAATPEA